MSAANCSKHPFEFAQSACYDCGHEMCHDCLVFARGPKMPAICTDCSIYAAGVRAAAIRQPKYDKKSMKILRKQLRAELREERSYEPLDIDALPVYQPPTADPAHALPAVASVTTHPEAEGDEIEVPGEDEVPAWKRSWTENWDAAATPAFQPGGG